jgi:hypothetical protein
VDLVDRVNLTLSRSGPWRQIFRQKGHAQCSQRRAWISAWRPLATVPETCPWRLDERQDEDFLPEEAP